MEQLSGHFPEAEALSRRILARAPFNIEAQYSLYLSLANQDNRQKEAEVQQLRYDELKKSLMRVRVLVQEIEQYKDRPEVMSELGEMMLNLGNEAEALHWLSKALKRAPRHKPTHEILVKYYKERNQPKKAGEPRKMIPPN